MKTLLLRSCLFLLALSSVRAETYEQKMVAAVVVAEAGGEGRDGMIAVAEVIRKRADEKGTSMLNAVTKRKAFSSLNGTTVQALYMKHHESNVYKIALDVVRLAWDEPKRLPGIANGANHYDRVDAHPWWAKGKKPVAIVGNHAFYKL